MKWWADWLVDNPRDHARCPGLTLSSYLQLTFRRSSLIYCLAHDRAKILCELLQCEVSTSSYLFLIFYALSLFPLFLPLSTNLLPSPHTSTTKTIVAK